MTTPGPAEPVAISDFVERASWVPTIGAGRAEHFDRLLHAWQARFTFFISPVGLRLAFADWIMHLANAPGMQTRLAELAVKQYANLARTSLPATVVGGSRPCIQPRSTDKRFSNAAWQQQPFRQMYQSFLMMEEWWHMATTGVHGVSPEHARMVDFTTRQILDILSPSNFLFTNPEVMNKTCAEGGQNLVRGMGKMTEDWMSYVSGEKPPASKNFQVGRNLAVTPGKVVFRNDLMELIQYAPATETVHAEPVFIVPAWIMKYYILDLSPRNSLVAYLVSQGFTVFMISWRNPGVEQRDVGMDGYRWRGIGAALGAINAIVPDRKVHAVGYCLGGTLLALTAAAMSRDGDDRFKSITLLATQTDFTEAGELMVFVNSAQVAYLEDTMWDQGYLDTNQMAGAFHLLNSNDLIWSRMIHQYLMGATEQTNDLMAWNADATRMPFKMHTEYLRLFFLNNDLAEGRYFVDGRPVALTDIAAPIFAVGTRTDHVAPWRSVYKINLLTDTEITFVLTSGGHNAGIVSELGHPGRKYQITAQKSDEHYIDPDRWVATTPEHEGSWWPAWTRWLAERSSDKVPPPPLGAAAQRYRVIGDAPGTYVMEP